MFLQAFLLISVPLAVVADGPRLSDLQQDLHRLAFVRHHVPSNPTNNLLVLNSQLGPFARILNALYLEQKLASAKPESDAILAELLNLGDLKVLGSAGKMNLKSVVSALKALKVQPNVSMSRQLDMKSSIAVLNELGGMRVKVDALSDTTPFLAEFKKCADYLNSNFKDHFNQLSIVRPQLTDLKRFTQGNVSNTQWTSSFTSIRSYIKQATTAMDALATDPADACSGIEAASASLVPLVQRSDVSVNFASRSEEIDKLIHSSSDLGMIQKLIRGQKDYSGSMEHLRAFEQTVGKLLAAHRKNSSRKFTPAFRSGVVDLSTLSIDVETPWIKEKVVGKKPVRFLSRALYPSLALRFAVQGVEGSLSAITMTTEITSSFRNLFELLKLLADTRKRSADITPILASGKSVKTDPSDIVSFYRTIKLVHPAVETFRKSLTDLCATDYWKQVRTDLEAMHTEYAVKTDKAEMEQLAVKFSKDGRVATVVSNLTQIAAAAVVPNFDNIPLRGLSVTSVEKASKWSQEQFPALSTFLGSLQSSGASEMLRAYQIVHQRKKYNFVDTLLDAAYHLERALTSFEHSGQALEYFGKIKDRNAAIVALKEWVGAEELVRVLGSGSLLIGDLGKALARREDLEMLVKSADEVGKQIDGLSDKKVKVHIRKRWGESAKIKSSLETLLTEADSLNKEIPATGAAEPSSLAPMLLKLKSITDPALDLMQMLEAVTLLKRSAAQHSDAVGEAMKALWGLSGLNLQFAPRSGLVTDATTPLTSFASFLDRVQEPTTTSPSVAAPASQQVEEVEQEDDVSLGLKIFTIVMSIIAVVSWSMVILLSQTKEFKREGGFIAYWKRELFGHKEDKTLEGGRNKKKKQIDKGKKNKKGGSKSKSKSTDKDKTSSESAEKPPKTPKKDKKKSKKKGSQPNTPSAESPAPKSALKNANVSKSKESVPKLSRETV